MITPVNIRDGHGNFFTPIRIILALMVIIGHSMMFKSGDSSTEPKILLHYTASFTAVNIFFIASGFLVTKSMLYRKNMPNFASARILRIFPALLVHVLVVALLVGGAITTLPLLEYLTHKDVLSQPAKVLSFVDTDIVLPGVFKENPEPLGSGALWTLRYEVLAYIGTAVLFLIGALKKKWMIAGQFLASAVIYVVCHRLGLFETLPATVNGIIRFMLPYSLGAAIFVYSDKIKFYWPVIPALFALTILVRNQAELEVVYNIALAYTLFTLAYIKAPKLEPLQKVSDISYGLYIYHWVVLQCLFMANPEISVVMLATLCILISTVLATGSWFIIEKPALQYKGRFAELLSFKRKQAVIAAK